MGSPLEQLGSFGVPFLLIFFIAVVLHKDGHKSAL